MKQFEMKQKELPILEKQLQEVEQKLDALPESGLFTDEWRQLTESAASLRLQIVKLKNDDDRMNYFLNSGELLFKYYDAQESLASASATSSAPTKQKKARLPTHSILNYFMTDSQEQTQPSGQPQQPGQPPPSGPTQPTQKPRKKASDIDSSDGLKRDKLLDMYLSSVHSSMTNACLTSDANEWGVCPSCSIELAFNQNESMLECSGCGYQEFILIDSEKPSYKDPPREITYFAYKKSNHFNEWLAQFQAKENTSIPQDIIDTIMKELKKERITDPRKLKREKIREILQKLKLNSMYTHAKQIGNIIQQQMTTLTLSKEMDEKLQHMFKEIQPAFIKYCPEDRSNFLSYPYVLYKLCQLLEMDEFLPCFQLLKCRGKLYEQDKVWQKICKDMRWEFIRSV